jgi:ribosomal protein S18 acetylase RimI-like enzyme
VNSRRSSGAVIRRGNAADLDALWAFEKRVWADRMSRRSLRLLLASPSAEVLLAQAGGGAITGVAIVLFRVNSRIARLYSIAVDPKHTHRGIASALLARAEKIARSRRCLSLRLEVHERNRGAIKVYRKAGYHEFGRYDRYYEDRSDALRFEKQLALSSAARVVEDVK